jgi:hypothetical protein
MLKKSRSLFAVGMTACLATTVAVAESPVDKAVKHCVDVVHSFPADQMSAQFFKKFDAYYNSASGRVENNAYLNGDLPVAYQFNKCMASQGFPLK